MNIILTRVIRETKFLRYITNAIHTFHVDLFPARQLCTLRFLEAIIPASIRTSKFLVDGIFGTNFTDDKFEWP